VSERRRQVAVIGAGGCAPGSEPARLAEEVGRRLAEAGVTVVCGGREAMAAAPGVITAATPAEAAAAALAAL
jgi:predicted Rossmann-fold nucleotide-binding protein